MYFTIPNIVQPQLHVWRQDSTWVWSPDGVSADHDLLAEADGESAEHLAAVRRGVPARGERRHARHHAQRGQQQRGVARLRAADQRALQQRVHPANSYFQYY